MSLRGLSQPCRHTEEGSTLCRAVGHRDCGGAECRGVQVTSLPDSIMIEWVQPIVHFES